jgi:hypothetical protein
MKSSLGKCTIISDEKISGLGLRITKVHFRQKVVSNEGGFRGYVVSDEGGFQGRWFPMICGFRRNTLKQMYDHT